MNDFPMMLGVHVVMLSLGAIVLAYAARKKPGFNERFRLFIYGYTTCAVLGTLASLFS